jgi:hypothetical protein
MNSYNESLPSEQGEVLRTMRSDLARFQGASQKAPPKAKPIRPVPKAAPRPKPKIKAQVAHPSGINIKSIAAQVAHPSGINIKSIALGLLVGLLLLTLSAGGVYLWQTSQIPGPEQTLKAVQKNIDDFMKQLQLSFESWMVVLLGKETAPPQEPLPPVVSPAAPFPVSQELAIVLPQEATKDEFLRQFQALTSLEQIPETFTLVLVKLETRTLDLRELFVFLKMALPRKMGEFLDNKTYGLFWYTNKLGTVQPGLAIKLKPRDQVGSFSEIVSQLRSWESVLSRDFSSFFLKIEPSSQGFQTGVANIKLLHRYQDLDGGKLSFNYAVDFEKGWLILTSSRESLLRLLPLLP